MAPFLAIGVVFLCLSHVLGSQEPFRDIRVKVDRFVEKEVPLIAAGCAGGTATFSSTVLTTHHLYASMGLSAAQSAAPLFGALSISLASIITCNYAERIGLTAFDAIRSRLDGKQHNSAKKISQRNRPPEVYALLGILAWVVLGGSMRMVMPSDLRFPGAYAQRLGSLPATLEYIQGTAKTKLQELGARYGCHTCGVRNAATWVGDHMPPVSKVLENRRNFLQSALNLIVTQRFFPQCMTCSNQQGPAVFNDKKKLITHACGGLKLVQCGSMLSLTRRVEDNNKNIRSTLSDWSTSAVKARERAKRWIRDKEKEAKTFMKQNFS
mmetsp:Transcript_8898/g.13285  ORF Transcript_8898/g.13285 Transcript_8898/m.13285 type:complete len:324 (+) Transcript_8898:27-998(+)